MKHAQTSKRKAESGQAVIIAVLFFLSGSFLVITGVAAPVLREVRDIRAIADSKQSYLTAEAVMEDAVYRLKYNLDLSSPETLTIGESTGTIAYTIDFGTRTIEAVGDNHGLIRKIGVALSEGIGVSFFYGVQSDADGILMENTSSILGNVYSNGYVDGSGNNVIDGDAVSAGPSGFMDGVVVKGDAYAHGITNADITGNAYYQTIDAQTDVGGSACPNVQCYPGSADQEPATLPIKDEWVASWEAAAEAGGVVDESNGCSGGKYTISSPASIGPVKILCDFEISGNIAVDIEGVVWVVGDISIRLNPTIRTSPALGAKSVLIIADDPANRETKSKIDISNSIFVQHGVEGSHLLFLSMNESAENGGTVPAITVRNSATGDFLVYAGHGEILLQNNVSLSEVTGYRIHTQNRAQVVYETGLQSLLFDSGPSGGYVIDSWGEE